MIETIETHEVGVLVTGDRKWEDIESIAKVLGILPINSVIIHGYANGADMCAELVAKALGLRTITCPAHWNHTFDRWIEVYGPCPPACMEVCGKAAGSIRNGYMLHTYSEHIKHVLAFHDDIVASSGTKNMLKRSQQAGIATTLYKTNGEVIPNPALTKREQSRRLKEVLSPQDEFFHFQ